MSETFIFFISVDENSCMHLLNVRSILRTVCAMLLNQLAMVPSAENQTASCVLQH